MLEVNAIHAENQVFFELQALQAAAPQDFSNEGNENKTATGRPESP